MRTVILYRIKLSFTIISFLLSGCGAISHNEVDIWIDAPLPGGRVMQGEEVTIQSHAYSSIGVVGIELIVDGEPYTRNSPDQAGAELVTLEQKWIAALPGVHSLQLIAYNSAGTKSNPRMVAIEVMGLPTATQPEPVQTATLQDTPTPTITLTPIVPTLTFTPAPAPVIVFTSDADSIMVGECTYLRWQVENSEITKLDDAEVNWIDARQVCLEQSTSYTIEAQSAGGKASKTIRIEVIKDTAGPSISNVQINPSNIFDNPSCGDSRSQIKTKVSDDSSGVKKVDIYYQVVASESGSLISARMNGNENTGYTISLGPEELTRSLALYGGGVVRFYLVAEDNMGNKTTSKTFTFNTQVCIL